MISQTTFSARFTLSQATVQVCRTCASHQLHARLAFGPFAECSTKMKKLQRSVANQAHEKEQCWPHFLSSTPGMALLKSLKISEKRLWQDQLWFDEKQKCLHPAKLPHRHDKWLFFKNTPFGTQHNICTLWCLLLTLFTGSLLWEHHIMWYHVSTEKKEVCVI